MGEQVRSPLPVGELFKLKPGDRFVAYWAKDDDPRDIRINYETLTVEANDGKTITDNGGFDWYTDEIVDPNGNQLNTSRGYAYFYRSREAPRIRKKGIGHA